jgi:hypothetical protein
LRNVFKFSRTDRRDAKAALTLNDDINSEDSFESASRSGLARAGCRKQMLHHKLQQAPETERLFGDVAAMARKGWQNR